MVAILSLESFLKPIASTPNHTKSYNFAATAVTQDGRCSRLELGLPVIPEILMPCEYLHVSKDQFILLRVSIELFWMKCRHYLLLKYSLSEC